MIPFSLRWFAFKMILRAIGSWVLWWVGRKILHYLAQKLNWRWLWRWMDAVTSASVRVQGDSDRGPWPEKIAINND